MVNIERNVVDVSSRLIIALLEKSYRNYNKAKKNSSSTFGKTGSNTVI